MKGFQVQVLVLALEWLLNVFFEVAADEVNSVPCVALGVWCACFSEGLIWLLSSLALIKGVQL